MRLTSPPKQVLVRELIGESLREERMAQAKTLRAVSQAARVSLGYLSEVERGQKEASSELLSSICSALEVPLSSMLREVSDRLAEAEGVSIPDTIPQEFSREFGDDLTDELNDDFRRGLAATNR